MEYLYTALISASLSFGVSIISYLYQFNRNRKVDFKAKIRILQKLVKQSVVISEIELKSMTAVSESIKADNSYIPQLQISPYPAPSYLKEKVIDDDYFIAFTTIFNNIIDAEKHFFSLKYSAVFMDLQIQQAHSLTLESIKKDNERRTKFVGLYQNALRIVQEELGSSDTESKEFIKQYITPIFIRFNNHRSENDEKGNVSEIYNYYLNPLKEMYTQLIPPSGLAPLFSIIMDMHYLYRDMIFKNDSVRIEIERMSKGLKRSVDETKIVSEFLMKPNVSRLYQKFY